MGFVMVLGAIAPEPASCSNNTFISTWPASTACTAAHVEQAREPRMQHDEAAMPRADAKQARGVRRKRGRDEGVGAGPDASEGVGAGPDAGHEAPTLQAQGIGARRVRAVGGVRGKR